MSVEWIHIGLAFIEGFALIISPCILPILPIILSGSLTGSKSRPVGIIIGFVIAFAFVTLFSRALLQLLHIDPEVLRNISFLALFLLGVVMMSTYLTDKFNLLSERLTRVGNNLQTVNNPESGFWGGLLFGGLVGIIWTPCAGPILAAVIVQTILQKTTFNSVLVVAAFGIGAALPMFLIALLGRQVVQRFAFFRRHTQLIRKLLGFIIITSVFFLIYTLGAFPSYGSTNNNQVSGFSLINGLEHPYAAPEIAGIDAWINSPPLKIGDLKGKVLLVDFWTYSCINCIRTLPYLKQWYANYHNKGLEIIGIHSPEFLFEHDVTNVKNAVAKYEIKYPVALDNSFATWQNFYNEYWPAHYLIDKEGKVVYEHFGEGEYDVTENNIRYLLGLNSLQATSSNEENFSSYQTPETYFGYKRADRLANEDIMIKDQPNVYQYPNNLSINQWALQGSWVVYADKIVSAGAHASIKIHYHAAKVYAVMGAPAKAVTVKIMANKMPTKEFTIKQQKLYTLINSDHEKDDTLEIIASAPGLEMYTFTFGN